ncbi:MAG: Dihydroxyacetone kinase 2 [Candelina mexicana]|nr:MAG: Dihydroxyacetone kinase 2 [Candelina mexicana]
MEYITGNVETIRVAFNRGVALPNDILTKLQTLAHGTIELEMSAHGEPGLQQISPIPSPKELVNTIIALLISMSDQERAFIPFSTDQSEDGEVVLLLLSFLGSKSEEVLALCSELAIDELEGKGFAMKRLTLGLLVMSLKTSGFGITLWRVPPKSGGAQPVGSRPWTCGIVVWRLLLADSDIP